MGTITRRLAVDLAAAGLLVDGGLRQGRDGRHVDADDHAGHGVASGGGSGTTVPEDDNDRRTRTKGRATTPKRARSSKRSTSWRATVPSTRASRSSPDARDAGPDELADHWDTLSDLYGQMSTVDENDPEAIGDMLDLMDDQEFLAAAAAIDDFAEEECGLIIDLDPADDVDNDGGLSDDTDTTELSDPAEDPTSIKNVKGFLAGTYGDEAWWPVLEDANSWGSSGTPNQVSWTVMLSGKAASKSLASSELVAACDAMADYLDDYETADVSIEISDIDDNVLVSREPGENCAAA